jgi:uncharacterized protein (DUF885 family)
MRLVRSAAPVLVALSAACATTLESSPAPTPVAPTVRDRARLDVVVDRVLVFRDGLLGEALDLGRVDREDRAAAATWQIAALSLLLDREDGVDVDASVDRDLARMTLDGAVIDLAIAHDKEAAIRKLAGPATGLAFLADPAPPSPATIELLAGGVDGLYPVAKPDAADDVSPGDLRAAARRNRQVAGLLRTRGAQSQVLGGERGKTAHAAADEAAKRADDFAGALEGRAEEKSKRDDWFGTPVGRETFVARLATRHGVDASPEELVAFGEEMLADTTSRLEALAAAEFPGKTWRQALAEVRADHATPAQIPAEAYEAATAARDFVIREGFVTIPEGARLAHIEMVDDGMARSYPFAAYSWRMATSDGESGRYVVSPGATWMSADQQEERLQGNCRAWTRVVAPHETWPGHHLQFWVQDHTVTRIRRETTTSVYVEGWGLYCEGLLDRHGFFPGKNERLARLVMRAWRAARVILDVKLHCEAMKPADAIDFLVEHVGMPRDGAAAEVRRYCDSATQPFSYAVGCREIERLYADEQARLGAAFDERAFHDKLLSTGAIPFRFVRRIFGYPDESTRLR